MAKKSTEKHENRKLKDLTEESKEVTAIESADKIVNELEALQKDDARSEKSKKDPVPEQAEHLHKLEKPNAFKRFCGWLWQKKFIVAPLLVIAILGVLAAIPTTRYGMTSWFWKESIVIRVIDDGNNRPVTEATVRVAGQTIKTDAKGNAKMTVAVGMQELNIQKKNYQTKTNSIEVPLFARGKQYDTEFHATGRISDIIITNRISGKAIKAALISVSKDDQARTDDSGKAQVVVPTKKPTTTATVTAEGYQDSQISIKQGQKNELQLTPTGKLYFLSKQRGVIDIVKTNLDGSDRQTVVPGTGEESDGETYLLASRDWRYLLLSAKRSTGKTASLYLFDTVKGSFETIDEGKANFSLIGWSGHNFFYSVGRTDKTDGDNGQTALKMINASSRKISVLDENQSVAMGMAGWYRQHFGNFYITEKGVVYAKTWSRAGFTGFISMPTDKTAEVIQVNSDGLGKKILKSYPAQTISYINAKLYEPQEIYFRIQKLSEEPPSYAELENGVYREGVNGDKYDSQYPTFIISPTGTQAFWSESRDGKNTLLLGGKNAENQQEVAAKSEFTPYGWFTDDYLLMQKANSELYITTSAQLKVGVQPVKVSDYHKPASFYGYGYGYGGQ